MMTNVSRSEMNPVTVSFLLLLTASSHLVNSANENTLTNDTLTKLLESLKSYLEPHQSIPNYDYSTNSSWLFCNVSIKDSSIFDPTNYDIGGVSVDMNNLNFTATLSFPDLLITGEYTDYIDNSLVHIEGGGNFNVNLTKFDATLTVTLNLTENQTLQLDDFIVDYKLEAVNMLFDNIAGEKQASDALNKLFNEAALDQLDEIKPDVRAMAKETAESYAAFILSGMNISQFIDYINSLAGNDV